MGAAESNSTNIAKSNIRGLAAPSFFRTICRLILAVVIVGGSYFAVGEGLRFYTDIKAAFKRYAINDALAGLEFPLDEKAMQIKNVSSFSREQIELALWRCEDGQIRTNMKLAAVSDIIEGEVK